LAQEKLLLEMQKINHGALDHWECGIQTVAVGLYTKFNKSQKVKTDKF
jgi:hypothetical protein